MKRSLGSCLLLLLFLNWTTGIACATASPPIEITGEGRISVAVENGSLNDMLRSMAEKKLFEVKGAMPGGEITLHFSNLGLEEAIRKIMRGYNYVLINQGASRKPILLLLGKVERAGSGEQPQPAARTERAINQPENQGQEQRMYVPPATLPPQAPSAPQVVPTGRPSPAPGRVTAPAPGTGTPPVPGTPPNPAAAAPAQQQVPQQQEPTQGQTLDGPNPGPNAGQGQENQQPPGLQSSGVSTRDLLTQTRVQ